MRAASSWTAILLAFALGILGAMQVGRVAPAAVSLGQSFDLSLTAVGWLISLISLAAALAGIAAGYLVAARGARDTLLWGTVLLAVAVAAGGVAPDAITLFAARLFEGVGYLLIVVAAPTLMVQVARPDQLARALGLWSVFYTSGLSLAALTGGWLSDLVGWRALFLVNGGVLAVGALALHLMVPRVAPLGTIARATPTRAAWILAAGFFGVALVALALLSMLPLFLTVMRGYSATQAGSVTALVALASLAGGLLYSVIAPIVPLRPLAIVASLTMIAGAAPAFAPELPPVANFAGILTAVCANGVLVALVFAAVPRMCATEEQVGPANGVIAQLGSCGAFVGPPLFAWIVSAAGWAALFSAVALCALWFLSLYWVTDRPARRLRDVQ